MIPPLILLYLIGVAVMLGLVLAAARMRPATLAEKEAQHGATVLWLVMVASCFASWPMVVYLLIEATRKR